MKPIYECDDVLDAREFSAVEGEIDEIISMLKGNEQNNDLYINKIDSIVSKIADSEKMTVGKALYKLFAHHKRNSLKIIAKMCFGLESNIAVDFKYIVKKPVIERTEYKVTKKINLDSLDVDSNGDFVYSADYGEPDLTDKLILHKEILDPEISREEDQDIGKYVEQTIGELSHSYCQWRLSDIDFTKTF